MTVLANVIIRLRVLYRGVRRIVRDYVLSRIVCPVCGGPSTWSLDTARWYCVESMEHVPHEAVAR